MSQNLFAGRVEPVQLEDEIQRSYLDYAMSVIVGRALPDVRDGLKPVHRRILWSMFEQGLRPDRPYRKSANVVGDVMSKYHPHGDTAIYDALVRMAQDFSLRVPARSTRTGTSARSTATRPAPRGTPRRASAPFAMEMLRDIEAETVDFVPNYDGYEQEPLVLPSRFPNLLVNGAGGIAVGMATNIPPHNLGEVIDAVVHYHRPPRGHAGGPHEVREGPRLPDRRHRSWASRGSRTRTRPGRGSIKVRAVTHDRGGHAGPLEHRRDRAAVPGQQGAAGREDRRPRADRASIKDIADVQDHSSGREGMRLVIVLKRGANPQVVLNQLYKHTQLQDSFGVIMLALVDGVPRTLNLAEMIGYYVDHQVDVVTRRTRYEKRKAEERDHIVQGLLIALDHLDEVIKIIRGSQDAEEARTKLMKKFKLSEIQANHILDMPLRRLTRWRARSSRRSTRSCSTRIKYLNSLLKDPKKLRGVIKEELAEIRKKHADARRTQIKADEGDLDVEDLIAEEDVVITVSRAGYVKRQPIDTFRRQGRGGKGVKGATLKEEDVIANVFTTTTHHWLLFFTTKGKVYRVKVHEVPGLVAGPRAGCTPRTCPGVQVSADEQDQRRARPQGVRGGPVPAVRHAQGHGEEDRAPRVRLAAHRPGRDQPEGRRRADRREAHRRQRRRVPRVRAGARRSGSRSRSRVRWAAPPPA